MPEELSLYEEAHLLAAAVRLHVHRHHTPPTPDDLAAALGFNVEKVHYLTNKLQEIGAIRILTGAFGTKVFLDDHTQLEELAGVDFRADIDDEVAAFQAAQAKKNEELARRFDKDFVDETKRAIKDDVSAKLADPSKMRRNDNPLDAMFKKK